MTFLFQHVQRCKQYDICTQNIFHMYSMTAIELNTCNTIDFFYFNMFKDVNNMTCVHKTSFTCAVWTQPNRLVIKHYIQLFCLLAIRVCFSCWYFIVALKLYEYPFLINKFYKLKVFSESCKSYFRNNYLYPEKLHLGPWTIFPNIYEQE